MNRENRTFTHNPEVVGSSPASATIKTQDFDKKSGVFSNFSGKNKEWRFQVDTNFDTNAGSELVLFYGYIRIAFVFRLATKVGI